MAKPCRILIMAKAPMAGYCKTRLIPALGANGAAALARAMLRSTVRMALQAQAENIEICIEICAAPSARHSAWGTVRLHPALRWSEQGEGDLGARMYRAARRAQDAGEHVVLIGTDCPEMRASHLLRAIADLKTHAASLIPTLDGGYALLALQHPHPSLFENMPWSSNAVAAQTLQRARQLGWNIAIQPALHDIDQPEDLQWLPGALRTAAATA